MPTPAAPPRPPAPAAGRPSARVATALLALGSVLAALGAPAAAMVPSTVLPGEVAGSDVVLDPPVVRAPDGRAEVDVVVGDTAPGDVVVHLVVHEPDVDRAGVVTVGPPSTEATVTAGSRLRPGERLRTVVTTDVTVLLMATVRSASPATTDDQDDGDSQDDEPRELVALVLPGDPGSQPVATLEVVEGALHGTVEVDAPLLVSVRLDGAASTTYPDRLVLPDTPLVARGEPASWPLASVLSVTDEEGRTVTASTDRGPLLWITALLVVLTAAATIQGWRWRRGRRVSADAGRGSSPP